MVFYLNDSVSEYQSNGVSGIGQTMNNKQLSMIDFPATDVHGLTRIF